MRAMGDATASASAPMPAETSLSTAASNSALGTSGGVSQPTLPKTESDPTSIGRSAIQPATGPVKQNQGIDSPTPIPGDNAGLAARLGKESEERSKRRNKKQQAGIGTAALS